MEKEKEYPTRYQRAACWGALTGLSIFTIVALTVGVLFGLVSLFVALKSVLLPVIIAGVLAYLLYPPVITVQKWVHKRFIAVLAVLAAAAAFVGGIGAVIVPELVRQTSQLIDNKDEIYNKALAKGKDFIEKNHLAKRAIDTLHNQIPPHDQADGSGANTQQPPLGPYTRKLRDVVDYHSESIVRTGVRWLSAGTRAIYGSLGVLVGAVMIPVFLFYFLMLGEKIEENWHTVLPLPGSNFRQEIVDTLKQINDNIVSFVRGQMLVSLIDGTLLGIALTVMGLPYAIVIGVAAAFLGIIPYIGMIATCIPALLLAWVQWHDAGHVVIVFCIFLGISQLDGWVFQPRILGKRLHMHDLTIMFSVLFWGSVLGGIAGALLAVPLTAAIKVVFMRYVWPTLHHAPRTADESPEHDSVESS